MKKVFIATTQFGLRHTDGNVFPPSVGVLHEHDNWTKLQVEAGLLVIDGEEETPKTGSTAKNTASVKSADKE